MNWMLTSQGQVVHLDAPLRNPGALSIRVVAHSLACLLVPVWAIGQLGRPAGEPQDPAA